ncbi:MAG: Na+/H+ antiporter subunit E [Bacillota bacterium]|nr:Na+/H+ antiporter subunit E [Bacillota bacterium]
MKKLTSTVSTFIFCYIIWALVTAAYSTRKAALGEYVVGIVICFIIALVTSNFLIRDNTFWIFYPRRFGTLLMFIPVYTWHMLKANWIAAKRVFSPRLNINPGIVKIQTDLKSDYGLAMLAGCITLAPGTIIMDIVDEQNKTFMYLHCIDTSNKESKGIKAIKGDFESWIRRIFK